MIIGIDASQANKDERTGTEWYAFYVLDQWIANNPFEGHTVRLYVQRPLKKDFKKLPDNWKVCVLQWPPKIFWTHIRLSLELFLHRIDLLFIPSHTIPLIHPKKTLTTIHDIGFEVKPELYSNKSVVHVSSPWVQRIISFCVRLITFGRYGANELDYQKFSVRHALKHAVRIFTVSEFSKSEIENTFPNHPKLIVAYNGIQHDEFFYPYPKDITLTVKKKYHLSTPYILSIGRVEKKKNSLETVKIFELVTRLLPNQNIQLVFAGSMGFGSDEIEAYISTHNLEGKVHFLGWVKQEDIPPLLAGASVFTFFSSYEGFGVPLVQSLAIGTLVIASDLEVFRELSQGWASLHSAQQTEECAKACMELMTCPDIKIIEQGTNASKKFTWERTSNIIANQILEVLAKKA